jgi:tetratricopeptide (TPR) repeat protein
MKRSTCYRSRLGLAIALVISLTGIAPSAQACKSANMSAADYLKQGEEKLRQTDYEGAIVDLTATLKLKPDSVEAYAYRGLAQFERAENQSAIADYNRALKLTTNQLLTARLLDFRGDAYQDQGDLETAIEDYQKAANLYRQINQLEKAEAMSNMIQGLVADQSRQPPITAEQWYQDARTAARYGEGERDLIGILNRIIKLKPDYAAAYLWRCQMLGGISNHPKALADCNQAIKLDPKLQNDYQKTLSEIADCKTGSCRTKYYWSAPIL